MKKLILISTLCTMFLLVAITTAFGQDKAGFVRVFEEYAQRDNTISFTFSKEMLDAVDIDLEWEEKIQNISGDIYQVKFIAFDRLDENDKIISRLDGEIRKLGYPVIPYKPDHTDDIREFRLYGKKDNDHYRQVHLLVKDGDGRAYLISVDGKLKVIREA
ncbi:MAG: DUF4252 domain-containing protein [Owenweeksia sp.]